MKKMNKGFTLVELVVVITILAILGTVALLSFRGYSGDARNSKRITDLNSIKNNITEQITN
jgi:prepilin-type N-terminal cleavage/methylation domain-containing protein